MTRHIEKADDSGGIDHLGNGETESENESRGKCGGKLGH